MYTYCEVKAKSTWGLISGNKTMIDVDFGQGDPGIFDSIFKGKSNTLKDDDTGKVKKFNSVIDALNYLSSLGWEYINCMVVSDGKQNVYHYIMRKAL